MATSSAGSVNGKHFTTYVETVEQLKREQRFEEAVVLLEKLIDAVEKEAAMLGWGVAPWYCEQTAIAYGKMKSKDKEIEILHEHK